MASRFWPNLEFDTALLAILKTIKTANVLCIGLHHTWPVMGRKLFCIKFKARINDKVKRNCIISLYKKDCLFFLCS